MSTSFFFLMTQLPQIGSPTPGNSGPSSARSAFGSRQHAFFAPSSFKHHPLFLTTSNSTYRPSPPSLRDFNSSSKLSVFYEPKFSTAFAGSGNYRDSGLGSLKRAEELKERSRLRKQQSMVERARMKQELLKVEELKRQRRYKKRELKRRQKDKELRACISVQVRSPFHAVRRDDLLSRRSSITTTFVRHLAHLQTFTALTHLKRT